MVKLDLLLMQLRRTPQRSSHFWAVVNSGMEDGGGVMVCALGGQMARQRE
jgi:hypothetical protein